MFRKFSLLAVLAILATFASCSADDVPDPVAFIKEAMFELSTARAQCQTISDALLFFSGPDYEQRDVAKGHFATCGKQLFEVAAKASQFDVSKIEDVKMRETILKLRNVEELYKYGEDVFEFADHWRAFEKVYNEEDITDYEDSDIEYSIKEIEEQTFITRAEDINEINYYWTQVADKLEVVTWKHFFEFADIIKKRAKTYNMTAAEFWYPNYSTNSMAELEAVMKELKPFYEQLHAYLRYKLQSRYGAGVIKSNGPIPETLFHQIEDQIWSPSNQFAEDFSLDMDTVDNFFEAEEMNVKKVLEMAAKFYESLGFEPLSEEYMKQHVHTEEEGECTESFVDRHANNLTFMYCPMYRFEKYLNYYEYYGRMHSAVLQKDEDWLFWHRNAWGKTIGRAVRLASFSQKHFEQIGLKDVTDEWMNSVNVRLAFQDVFGLARKYVNLRVIIDYFDNKVEKDDLNKHYWQLFEEYAGVEPPIDRTEESLDLPYELMREVFDNRNLIRDFRIKINVFEVYKAACHMAGYTGPLHECDFYGDKKVGEAFKKILTTEVSKPFNFAIEPLIPAYNKLSAAALIAYFEPTFDWMKSYNKKHNLTAGWDHSKKNLNEVYLTNEEEAIKLIEEASTKIYKLYDMIASDLFNKKNVDEQFESEFYGNTFWKVSKAAEAASELTEISKKAKQFDVTSLKSKPLQKAILKLTQVADVFVLGEDMEDFVYNKQRLFNISLDDDIPKYKESANDDSATVPYNPYILNVFRTSKDAEELKFYWEQWRDRNGAFAKMLLMDIFKSLETAATKLEISTTEFWFKYYSSDYVKKMEKVIDAVRPFYEKLHKYVYELLLEKYSKDDFSMVGGAIPDHFVQQVLLQIWTNESIVEADFPWHKLPPYEHSFAEKKYEPLQLFKMADEFYKSLGFEPVPEAFWTEQVKPEEGSAADGDCHATIYDMTPKVYIKYCERVSFRKFLQAHGYMGRVHYAIEKKDLPGYYFDSYNFEYPVGEAIILDAGTPKHAKMLGLITDFEVTDEVLLNRLIRMAIHTMFNLHKYFVHTKVVSEYLEGDIEKDEFAKYYWKYMITYAGIEPPIDRKDDAFDFPFEFYTDLEQNHQVKKFTAEVLGYRIYERLCKLSGHEGDLNNCCFHGSTAVGDALKSMMKLGSTLPRSTVLKRLMQDVSDLDANSMLTYYAPLKVWLKKYYMDDKDIYSNSFDSYRQYLHAEYFA